MIAPVSPSPRYVVAVDPGSYRTAWIVYDRATPSRPVAHYGLENNEAVRLRLRTRADQRVGEVDFHGIKQDGVLAIEAFASMGMSVGAEVFLACEWVGRFIEAWDSTHQKVYRRDVKIALCGSSRAKDANIRTVLIDKFGGLDVAMGRPKKCAACRGKGHLSRHIENCPSCRGCGKQGAYGPLHGLHADLWQALAVAVYTTGGAAC